MSSELPRTHENDDSPPARMGALERTFHSVLDAGKEILARRRAASAPANTLDALVSRCMDLLNHRGEASGLALASEITVAYGALPDSEREAFFQRLLTDFDVNRERLLAAVDAYRDDDDYEQLAEVARSVEAPRQKLFRRFFPL